MQNKEQDVLEQLQARLEVLQTEVEMLKAAQKQKANPVVIPANTSRRRLLKHLAVTVAGAAAVTAFTSSQQDAAAVAEGTVSGTSTANYGFTSASNNVAVFKPTAGAYGLIGYSQAGTPIAASANNNIGVLGFGGTGVRGISTSSVGVQGNSTDGTGIVGVSVNGIGVSGQSSTAGNGVNGTSVDGIGVNGGSTTGTGVNGTSTTGTGVNGSATTTGIGVNGTSVNGTGLSGTSTTGIGINGTSASNIGIAGSSNTNAGVMGDSTSGAGLMGTSDGGYGANLQGGRAPLYLNPGTSAGAPTGNHQVGELYVDSEGALFYAVASGTPASWLNLTNATILTFLLSPIRVSIVQAGAANVLTSSGASLNPLDVQITNVTVNNSKVPLGARGIIASLTSIGATSSGNLRLWPTGSPIPNANTLNIPAKPDGTGFNLTSTVVTGLSDDGFVSIAFAGTDGATCGFAIDVVAYIS